MSGMQWFLIILLVLLIAAGIFLLTRRPSAGSDGAGAPARDVPGAQDRQAVAGGATAGTVEPEADTRSEVYDQEADQRHPVVEPVEPTYTDTATGTEKPVEDGPGHIHEDAGPVGDERHDDAEAVTTGEPSPAVDDTTYADTSYEETRPTDQQTWDEAAAMHEQPVHEEPVHEEPTHEEPVQGEIVASDHPVDDASLRDADNDSAGGTRKGSYAAGSDTAPEGGATEHTDIGHPGPSSQVGEEATYAPGEVGADSPGPEPAVGDAPAGSTIAAEDDQGHPGPSSQPGSDATYAPTADEVVAEAEHEHPSSTGPGGAVATGAGATAAGAAAAGTAWRDDTHDDVPEDAGAAGFADTDAQAGERSDDRVAEHTGDQEGEHADDTVYPPVTDETTTAEPVGGFDSAAAPGGPTAEDVVERPYGPGSAAPAEDGSGPEGWQVKGNSGSMLFHTPDSPGYDNTRAEVWFESEEAARSAGFAHWDRKRR